MAFKTGVEFPLLFTSSKSLVPESYGVFNLFGDGLASASLFLINETGQIVWKSVGKNTSHFVNAEVVLEKIVSIK